MNVTRIPVWVVVVAGVCLGAWLCPKASATRINLGEQVRSRQADDHYNLRYGNLRLALAGSAAVAYDTNIGRAEPRDQRQEGYSVSPGLGLALHWPVNPHLDLSTGANVTYRWYPNGTAQDQLSVTGFDTTSARAAVDMKVSDTGQITVADEFTREVDSLDIAARNFPEDYAMNRNTVSLQYSTELSTYLRTIAKLAHTDAWADEQKYQYQDHQTNSVDAILLWRANRNVEVGPYARWQNYNYRTGEHNDAVSVEGGVAFLARTQGGLTLEGSFGWEALDVKDTNRPTSTEDGSGPVGRVGLSLATSKFTNHRLYASYARTQGTLSPQTNYLTESGVGYSIGVQVLKTVMVTGSVDWRSLVESDRGESADLVRLGLGTAYQLTQKATVGLRYEYAVKTSDVADRDYDRHFTELSFRYRF